MSVKIATPEAPPRRADWRPEQAARVRQLASTRRIVRRWRVLTAVGASQRTLVACSGGADSTALALALASATRDLAIAHVLHDLRPQAQALADRDSARALAETLDLPFVEARVQVRQTPGNAEALARKARYAALATLAHRAGAPFVAVAHHADDQLETLVMGLIRGSGPRGLSGAAERRALDDGVWLIRPMLGCARMDAERLCAAAGLTWREDATNTDMARLRAFLRHGPLADVRRRRPAASMRAARAARLCRDAAGLVRDRARAVFGDGFDWPREALARERSIVIAEGLRLAFRALTCGEGLDRVSGRLLDDACRAIRDGRGGERRFAFPARLELRIDSSRVRLSRIA